MNDFSFVCLQLFTWMNLFSRVRETPRLVYIFSAMNYIQNVLFSSINITFFIGCGKFIWKIPISTAAASSPCNHLPLLKCILLPTSFAISATNSVGTGTQNPGFGCLLYCTMYDFHDSTDIFVNPSFFHFVPKSHPKLALKTGIWVPKFAYDLPEFKIRPWDNIAIIHTWSMEHMCITIFAKKCQ